MSQRSWVVTAEPSGKPRGKLLALGFGLGVALGVVLALRLLYPADQDGAPPEPVGEKPARPAETAPIKPEAPLQKEFVAPPSERPVVRASAAPAKPAAAAPANALAYEDLATPDHWRTAVNILANVDPARDAVSGKWTHQDGALCSDASSTARIGIPYQPPEEYDLRVVFTRTSGKECVIQVFTAFGRQFAWLLGGWDNTLFGFEMLGDQRANANATTVQRSPALENGRKYTTVVRIRRKRLQAYLDGQLLTDLQTDYGGMSLPGFWTLGADHALGLGSHGAAVRFHAVELLDVTRAPPPAEEKKPRDSEF
jgi:hypothetical protein